MNKLRFKAFAVVVLLIFIPCFLYGQKKTLKKERVDNIILLIGDGMGLGQVSAYMIENKYEPTAFDRAEYTAICKTYSANNRVTDSGASATAMATGYKTNNATIGMTPEGEKVPNITELAEQKGLSTAIVVTKSIADATPAGFTAHNKNRKNLRAIAEDISESGIDVIVGGGRALFRGEDGQSSLIAAMQEDGYKYVSNLNEFMTLSELPVLCLAAEKELPIVTERDEDFLANATKHTLELLSANKKGFFAMIEGSQIDGAAHRNNMERLMGEMGDFAKAVDVAFDFADSHPNTLVLVVGDHETGGLTTISKNKDFTTSESGLNYDFSTTSHSGLPVILYAYGAGARNFGGIIENTDIFHLMKSLLIDK